MEEIELAVSTMVMGAILGAVLSPAIDHIVANKFAVHGPAYSNAQGLMLLCSANAGWVLSFITLKLSTGSLIALIATCVLYFITIVFFLASYNQFKGSQEAQSLSDPTIYRLILPLLSGNSLWLLGEASEIILIPFGVNSFPFLYGKYVCFFFSGVAFLYGIVIYKRLSRDNA